MLFVDWPTGDMEWYDPGQITTKDGALVIEMRQEPTHEFDYRSGMLQSWNKFCFSKNAYIEGKLREKRTKSSRAV
jgi:beta-glucanase (GH16 family)